MVETERLILRRWKGSDIAPFSKMNSDPRVMEFFPAILTRAETEAMVKGIEEKFDQCGFSFWATELKSTGELIGMIGQNVPAFESHFTPCVEVGWRLASEHWGKGLAVEAARASLEYGFNRLKLQEIVAFTAEKNKNSRRVMEKLNMIYDPSGDFDHPKVTEGHPLRRHVLYRKPCA